MHEFASRLAAALRASGMTEEALAEKAGIGADALERMLAGEDPRLSDVIAIAAALGTTVGGLLGEQPFTWSREEAAELRRVLDEAARVLKDAE